MKRVWIKLSVDRLLSEIAYNDANGFCFEARALRGLFKMTKDEKKIFEIYLESCKAAKVRRENNYQ